MATPNFGPTTEMIMKCADAGNSDPTRLYDDEHGTYSESRIDAMNAKVKTGTRTGEKKVFTLSSSR